MKIEIRNLNFKMIQNRDSYNWEVVCLDEIVNESNKNNLLILER